MEDKEKDVKKVEEDDGLIDPDDFDEEEDGKGEGDPETSVEGEKKPEENEPSDEEKEKEKNAKAAERRRQREKAQREREAREAEIREEATLQAKLGILKVNPYTEEPIVDAEDLKIYELQKELEDEGKDPINDLPKKIAENARKSAKEAKERQEKEDQEKAAIDKKVNEEIADLKKQYPKVNLSELAKDETYKECLKGRAGRWTAVEIYELYLSKKAEENRKAEEEAAKKATDEAAKKLSSPPSATAKGSSPQKIVDEMTREEFEEYFRNKYNA